VIRVGPHIASRCVCSVLLRAIGDFSGILHDCMVERYQLSSHALMRLNMMLSVRYLRGTGGSELRDC
jgi:hypothetical protein